MPYHERIGASKLRIVADGLRFTRVILRDVLCYRPERIFLGGFMFCLLLGALLAAHPIEFYWLHRRVEEWMIYRFFVVDCFGSVGFQLLVGAALAYRMASLGGPRRRAEEPFWPPLLAQFFEGPGVVVFGVVLAALSLALLWPAMVEYASTLHITMHWSRFVTAVFGLLVVAQAAIAGVLMRIVRVWKAQLPAERQGR